MVAYAGPLKVNIGGEFGDEEVPTDSGYDRELLDGSVVSYTFDTLVAAEAWIDQMEIRVRQAMQAIRAAFMTYPGTFMDDFRTV